MNKKALKQLCEFIVLHNWALSIGMVLFSIPIWNELNLLLHILVIALAVTAILEIPILIFIICIEISYKRFCTAFAEGIQEIRKLHNIRYTMYISGNTKCIDEYTSQISTIANSIIKSGSTILKCKGLTQQQRKQVENAIEETQYLLTNVQPKNRAL